MTRGNPSDLQPFDPEIDRKFHRLVRHHFIPFDHPEHSITRESVHSVIGDFEHPDFEHYNFEHSCVDVQSYVVYWASKPWIFFTCIWDTILVFLCLG